MIETHHHFQQQIQAHFTSQGARGLQRKPRHSFVMMPAIHQTWNGPRPMLRASQNFEHRESTGRVVIVIACHHDALSRNAQRCGGVRTILVCSSTGEDLHKDLIDTVRCANQFEHTQCCFERVQPEVVSRQHDDGSLC